MADTCSIPSGTYEGAINSIEVTPERIVFMEIGKPGSKVTFDWKSKCGTFNVEGGEMVVKNRPAHSNEKVILTTVFVRPGTKSKEFPCLNETGFWFYDGKYDGDDNGLDCPEEEIKRDASKIVDRYDKMHGTE